jgi:dipeptidyl aminopeptidase/acylaminoacyl peptidase
MLRLAGLLAGAALLGLDTLPGAAHAAAFTIEQVMAAPFPSSLVAASGAKAAAWVFDDRGCRNVWVADAAHGMAGRAVTTFSGDQGFNIGELAFSPDARWLAFTRGGSLEDDRPANTDSSAEGPTPREIWLVASAGGAARSLHAGHSPAFSPDGSRLVFADGAHLWSYATDAASAPETLLVDAGQVAPATFSPDGRRLAFVSRRPQHSLIGVYDFATRHIVWLSPSLDQDASPVFSPDGLRIAFIRVPTEDVPIFVTRRSGQPWSIQVADVRTGAGQRVWVADAGAGSVFQPTQSEQNLFWTSHDRLVFPWEKTGWLQLYTVAASRGTALPVTSGTFEIAHLALSPDRSRIVYSSNQDDRDRLHVWSVDPEHGRPVRAGRDSAIEDAPQTSPDGTLYALESDATRPLQPVMLAGGRWQPLAPGSVPGSFPQAQLVTPQSVTFPASDGETAYGQIFEPRGAVSGRRPAILFFHGGPEREMLLGFHPMDAYSFMYALNQYFVAEGYVVLSVNYRGGSGYGLDFREAPGLAAGGASELRDLLGAVAYLKGRSDVDARRIGIWGGSYGGLMTALGLARASRDIAAGVDYAGLYNWATFLKAIGVPASPEATRLALDSSPSATIDAWRSPVLVVQADDDRDVPFSQSAELIEALRAHHIDHEEMILPNEIHDLARYASWLSFFQAADRYFERHLQAAGTGATRQ